MLNTMSDTELYDEFGNYIGPDLDSNEEESEAELQEAPDDASEVSVESASKPTSSEAVDRTEMAEPMNAIVLHEDKTHYPEASQVYGEDVRTAVLDEDAMDLETPIVEPIKEEAKVDTTLEDSKWMYTDDYLKVHIQNTTTRTRRFVSIIGHFHHGKTSLVDLLLGQSYARDEIDTTADAPPQLLYTDTTKAEKDRQMSLHSTPLTTLLADTRGKTFCVSFLDTPGHVNFHDETVASLAMSDGALLCVDVVEGVCMHTRMAIEAAVAAGLPLVLVLTKMDRLVVELQLPPRDAYYKLLHTIDSVNQVIGEASKGRYPKLHPSRGNVVFSSSVHGWLFTLESFAEVYLEHNDNLGKISVEQFGHRLWGDSYLDPATTQFHSSPRDCATPGTERTFVAYVLAPLYKLYSTCLGEREPQVNSVLRSLGVLLTRSQLRASPRVLLLCALSKFFQTACHGLVDALVQHVPCPAVADRTKLLRNYAGDISGEDLLVHATKLYKLNGHIWTLGRVYAGTLRAAQEVRVLGPSFSEDDEDVSSATIQALAIPRGRNIMHISSVGPGNWVLLQGVDGTISKSATIIDDSSSLDDANVFHPLRFPSAGGESVVKVAIEPLNPSELPKMVHGLRELGKLYPMAQTKVEESGEHILMGTGELYMDCLLHDLREHLEVKVADPIVSFRETVVETSAIPCVSETANKRNKFTFMAEPLDEGLAEELESGVVKAHVWDRKKLGRFFQTKYGWDLLASRSVWAFGDSPKFGTNVLLDDTLPGEVDKSLLNTTKNSIVQGFQWATREGPLCEEPVRGCKVKLLDVSLADKPIHRGGGQVIPTARRTVHSALLTATPRLLEPVYRVEVQCPAAIIDAIAPVLNRRRGHIVQDRPIAGTAFASIKGFCPVLDSFGLETDLRTFTQGQAMIYSVFDHWSVVPGDPLDQSILLHPLEPSPNHHLARELLLKTRRRKGLSEDVDVTKILAAAQL